MLIWEVEKPDKSRWFFRKSLNYSLLKFVFFKSNFATSKRDFKSGDVLETINTNI